MKWITLALLGLSACGFEGAERVTRAPDPAFELASRAAADGRCFTSYTKPAIIETVTEQVLAQSERRGEDGQIVSPATYKTLTRQAIVEDRQRVEFETPCAEVMDTTFIQSLQRALKARTLYRGPVTGEMSEATQEAVRRYQHDQAIDIGILTMESARTLGLIATPLRNL